MTIMDILGAALIAGLMYYYYYITMPNRYKDKVVPEDEKLSSNTDIVDSREVEKGRIHDQIEPLKGASDL